MLWLEPSDIVMKKSIELYNNIATSSYLDQTRDDGRLKLWIDVFPFPVIRYQFETIGEHHMPPFNSNRDNDIHYNSPVLNFKTTQRPGMGFNLTYSTREGTCTNITFGDGKKTYTSFVFYLCNMKVQDSSFIHQDSITKSWRKSYEDENNFLSEHNGAGRYLDVDLGDGWSFRIEIRDAALKWLKNNPAYGTLVTTKGNLYRKDKDIAKGMCVEEAMDYLKLPCLLLSFANGGYSLPIWVQGRDSQSFEQSSAFARCWQTTAMESLASSWCGTMSNLNDLLKTLPTFEMIYSNTYWRSTFFFVIDHCFTALRKETRLDTSANAIGAALERLTYTILVEDESDPNALAKNKLLFDAGSDWRGVWNAPKTVRRTVFRTQVMLNRIGLNDSRASIEQFLRLRNDSVHPLSSGMSLEESQDAHLHGIRWTIEALLWRIGYTGHYWDFVEKGEREPRYNIRTNHLLVK